MRTSPARAPPLRNRRSGCAAPITASPYLGSTSRIVWPPASIPPASRTLPAAASKTVASAACGKPSGKTAMDSANRTRPPIAKMSDRALAAAISPYAAGSATSGGKKSSVPRIARSSEIRYAAASSGGWSPAMSAASPEPVPVLAPSPASASASRSAPSFAAQPPHSVSSVRRIGDSSVVIGPMIGAPCDRSRRRVARPVHARRRGLLGADQFRRRRREPRRAPAVPSGERPRRDPVEDDREQHGPRDGRRGGADADPCLIEPLETDDQEHDRGQP